MSNFIPPTNEPVLLVRNISTQDINILGKMTLRPGEEGELFSRVQPDVRHDLIIRAARDLMPPLGQMYLDWKVNNRIEILDFRVWAYSVDESLIRATNEPFLGAVLGFHSGGLKWVSSTGLDISAPLVIQDGALTIPKATGSQDGFLSKEDYQYIFSSIRRKQKIWQYQDFPTGIGSSIELSDFQNGTGLLFDASYIVNDTAEIVLASDFNSVPTTTVSFPGRLLPGNRIAVTSHIGDTVILNQSPANTLACRVYFLIALPDGVNKPYDYQEAPQFLKNSPSSRLDEAYVNANQDEVIYGAKDYQDSVSIADLTLPSGASDGYILTSDAVGNAYWSPNQGGSGSGGTGDGVPSGETPPVSGNLWYRPSANTLYTYDSIRDKWLTGENFVDFTGGASVINTFLSYHPRVSSAKVPFKTTKSITITYYDILVAETADFEIAFQKNNVTILTAAVDGTRLINNSIDIDMDLGDTFSVFVVSGEISYPIVRLGYRFRG